MVEIGNPIPTIVSFLVNPIDYLPALAAAAAPRAARVN